MSNIRIIGQHDAAQLQVMLNLAVAQSRLPPPPTKELMEQAIEHIDEAPIYDYEDLIRGHGGKHRGRKNHGAFGKSKFNR